MSVNKVIILGNLGADPEVRYTPSGDAICNLRIATTDKWKDKQTSEPREATEWHRVSFFGRQAEIAGQYLKKGSSAYIEGSIRTRKFQDKESGQDRYSTEIRGDVLQLIGGRQAGDTYAPQTEPQRQTAPAKKAAPAAKQPNPTDFEDDIPF